MGVMATYCQICGIPVHQDHYVPMGGMLGIFRGGGDDPVASAIAFGPEHAWLKDAVGLALNDGETPVIIEGEVHDGGFETDDDDGLVMEGIEDRVALHRACWEIAGKPEGWEELEGSITLPEVVERYREQLFEFKRFVADGQGWMLVSPGGKTDDAKKNRVRILRALGRKG